MGPLTRIPPAGSNFFKTRRSVHPATVGTLTTGIKGRGHSRLVSRVLLHNRRFAGSTFSILDLFPSPQCVAFTLFAIAGSMRSTLLSTYHFLAMYTCRKLYGDRATRRVAALTQSNSCGIRYVVYSAVYKRLRAGTIRKGCTGGLVTVTRGYPSTSLE